MSLDMTRLREKYELAYAGAIDDERLSFENWLMVELERQTTRSRYDGEALHLMLTRALDWISAHASIRLDIIKLLCSSVPVAEKAPVTDILPHTDPSACASFHEGCHCKEVLELWATGDWARRRTR